MIELTGVSKQYLYGARAIGTFDMRVGDGETVALLGDKGSGKTTLLKAIAGITDFDGVILIDGEPIEKRPDNVIMLFDDSAVFKNRSFYYNLAYPLRVRGMEKPEIDRRVKYAAQRMGITACLYEKVSKMPLIDVKRLSAARLFVREYSVLLADDITSGLARDEAELLWREIAPVFVEKAKAGVSVVYATEYADEALSVADRIAVMHYGEIKQIGTLEDIRREPSNIWAAQALDSDYRFERARLERRNGRLTLVLGVETPTEEAREFVIDAEIFADRLAYGYEDKDIFVGWNSDKFAEHGERTENVIYALRDGEKYVLHTESGARVRKDGKADKVCTLPDLRYANLYDFASENSILR